MTGVVVWITGLPASVKSTLAHRVRTTLATRGHTAVVLDSDDIRTVLDAHTYQASDRDAFYRTLAGLAGYIARQHVTFSAGENQ